MNWRKAVSAFVIVSFIALFTACSSGDVVKEISKASKADLYGGSIEQEEDTHGGFHGDGYLFVKIKYEDVRSEELAKELESNKQWRRLPLSENLSTLVYGKHSDRASVGSYVMCNEGEALFPPVDKGYYFFMDRHSESTDKKDDSNIFSRSSMNFTIAIYDEDNGMLYYYELDT